MVVEQNIVKNKKEILEQADKITTKMLELIKKEAIKQPDVDNPSESIYLMLQIVSQLTAKICVTIPSYGKIYQIEKLNSSTVHKWINNFCESYIKLLEDEDNKK